jgi:hypothetical protein
MKEEKEEKSLRLEILNSTKSSLLDSAQLLKDRRVSPITAIIFKIISLHTYYYIAFKYAEKF